MIIGFTGTQIGMSDRQKMSLRRHLVSVGATEFHHGDCIGADADAHWIAIGLGCRIVIHPPEISSKRAFCKWADCELPAKPYLDRNHDIVDCCDKLIAAPKSLEEELRSGTWATVRYAKKAGKPGVILAR